MLARLLLFLISFSAIAGVRLSALASPTRPSPRAVSRPASNARLTTTAADLADAYRSGQRVPPGVNARCCRLERRLFDDARDGRLDQHRLLTAGLIASGVTDLAMLEQYQNRYDRMAALLKQTLPADAGVREKASHTLRFLHAEVLRGGYHREISTLSAAFDGDGYNCVSSAVLFNCLARSLGLEVCGVQVPGHAFSLVLSPAGEIEVQTTCASWFELPKESPGAGSRRTAGADAAERGSSEPRRRVSDAELVAMIYFNRGVTAIRTQRFREALADNFKALWLDPRFDKAAHNLLATIDQWETDLNEQSQYADALVVLSYGLFISPGHETFRSKYREVCRRCVDELVQSHRYEQALVTLDQARRLRVEDPWILSSRRELLRHHYEALQGPSGPTASATSTVRPWLLSQPAIQGT